MSSTDYLILSILLEYQINGRIVLFAALAIVNTLLSGPPASQRGSHFVRKLVRSRLYLVEQHVCTV